MANMLHDNGLNKFDWIGLGAGIATIALGLVGAVCSYKGNQQRANQVNAMLDSRVTQPPQFNNQK